MVDTLLRMQTAHDQHSQQLPGNILIVVLLIMMVAIMITGLVVTQLVISTQSIGATRESERVRAAAESGVENAILILMRNPAYSGGSYVFDGITVQVNLDNQAVVTLQVVGSLGLQRHAYQVVLERQSGKLVVTQWREVS